jgi:hypothetical protein
LATNSNIDHFFFLALNSFLEDTWPPVAILKGLDELASAVSQVIGRSVLKRAVLSLASFESCTARYLSDIRIKPVEKFVQGE